MARTKLPTERIVITLLRAHYDGHDQPCIFYWTGAMDGSASDGFILLRHTADGQLEKVHGVEYEGSLYETPNMSEISGLDYSIREISPGSSDRYYQPIPGLYRDALIPGERYELVWSGGEICWWTWGTIKKHEGQTRDSKPPPLILPGGSYLSFTAIAERPPPVRQPSPPPIQASERTSGTPALSVTLAGPNQKRNREGIMMDFTITYHGVTNEQGEHVDGAWPVTLSNGTFPPNRSSDRLYLRNENGQWEETGPEVTCGGYFIDEDRSITMGEAQGFPTLHPGTSHTYSFNMEEAFPEVQNVGEFFRYRYKGATVNWWDWGTKEDYASTVITLPSFSTNGSIDPPGNPLKLVVPASNDLEITIVE